MKKADNPAARRRQLYALLGDLPARSRPVSARLVSTTRRPEYEVERLLLNLNGIEPVPAYFVKPAGHSSPLPCVLYNHAHGGDYVLGKDELLDGRPGIQKPAYGEELAQRNLCALCIDAWAFGERRGRTESEIFKEMLWSGRVMWGMMVYDSIKAVDYLISRPDVDAGRIGTLGLSMGSTMAWWLAALDTRVKVCIDICCLTDFHELIATRSLDGHGIYYYVPSLLKHFSTSDINALIAPRPHLSLAGNYDRLTPSRGLDRIDAAMRRAYGAAGRRDAWQLRRYETGHMETAAMRAEALAFLDTWL